MIEAPSIPGESPEALTVILEAAAPLSPPQAASEKWHRGWMRLTDPELKGRARDVARPPADQPS